MQAWRMGVCRWAQVRFAGWDCWGRIGGQARDAWDWPWRAARPFAGLPRDGPSEADHRLCVGIPSSLRYAAIPGVPQLSEEGMGLGETQ
jgi:hypothetical protein